MKKFIRRFLPEILLLVLAVLFFLHPARAQGFAPEGTTDQLMNTPLSKIQLNGLTFYAVIRIFGQAYAAIRSGGGLKGIFNALVYGENAPKVILQDYRNELGLKAVPVTTATSDTPVIMTAQPSPAISTEPIKPPSVG